MTSPAFFLLVGYPGTGKLTIATELVEQLNTAGRPCRPLHNHAATQVLFSLTPAGDGRAILPDALFGLVREMNYVVLRAVDEGPPQQTAKWSGPTAHSPGAPRRSPLPPM